MNIEATAGAQRTTTTTHSTAIAIIAIAAGGLAIANGEVLQSDIAALHPEDAVLLRAADETGRCIALDGQVTGNFGQLGSQGDISDDRDGVGAAPFSRCDVMIQPSVCFRCVARVRGSLSSRPTADSCCAPEVLGDD